MLGQIADGWPIHILTVVCVEPAPFDASRRRLDGITHEAPTEALRRLQRDGLVARRVLTMAAFGVRYPITPLTRYQQSHA